MTTTTEAPPLRLTDVAKHVVLPSGIVKTGWPAVRDTLGTLGVRFDEWEVGCAKAVLAKDVHGLYAADTVAVSIPRQVGKTFMFGWIIFALCLIRPGTTVLWTAHRFKTARETFASMKSMARTKRLLPHILATPSGGGNEAIVFRNGSRILFGARERGFGRGFAEVDIIVFDEAQILSQNAVDDMVPATNQAPNPLIVYTGTPPRPNDPAEVFSTLRREAIAGESEDVLYIEFSADADADPNDRAQWRKANPSYPTRTTDRAILRMKKNLTPDSFLREALGIWDEDGPDALPRWSDRAMPGMTIPTSFVVGIAASRDGTRASIGAAAMVGDVLVVGVIDRRKGKEWLVDEVKRLTDQGVTVAIRTRGAAADLLTDFDDAGIPVEEVSEQDYVDACGTIARLVEEGGIVHPNHSALNRAVRAVGWRKVGDRRAFEQQADDVSMLEAVTVASVVADSDYSILDSVY